jgi:uncharacterized membrane protein
MNILDDDTRDFLKLWGFITLMSSVVLGIIGGLIWLAIKLIYVFMVIVFLGITAWAARDMKRYEEDEGIRPNRSDRILK